MKPLTGRDLSVQVFTMLAAGAGVSILLLAPLKQELRQTQARLEAGQSLLASTTGMHAGPTPQHIDALLAERTTQIASAGAAASDISTLHALLMDLGRRMGVTIESITPEPVQPRAHAREARHLSRVIICTTLATGDYANLIEFLRALEQEAGHMSVQSCALRPTLTAEGAVVSLALVTEHFAFHVPTLEELQQLAAAGDEDEEE